MKQLKNKLHNSRGASMIIAMIFMLICLFVGGSVLVAATMNTYRIGHVTKQQEFLDQRSAAMLIADELKVDSDKALQLIVREQNTDTQKITSNDKEKIVYVGNPSNSKIIEFEAVVPEGVTLSAMQRTMLETTVRKYLEDTHYAVGAGTLSFVNFPGNPARLEDFWSTAKNGSMEITVQSDVCDNANFKAVFCSEDEELYDLDVEYDYAVSFEKLTAEEAGEKYSQLEVRLQSAVGKTKTPAVEEIIMTDEHNGKSEITTTVLTVISWSDPVIEKGA